MKLNFEKFAEWFNEAAGSSKASAAAFVLVVVWAASRPLFSSTDLWMLIINTVTTIVTFLMVFLIQNSQNRNSKALHLKLDELIRVNEKANDSLTGIEKQVDQELEKCEDDNAKG